MRPWYEGVPCPWEPERYAWSAYGAGRPHRLTRQEPDLYILDAAYLWREGIDIQTFPSLRRKEEKFYGEYRTRLLTPSGLGRE